MIQINNKINSVIPDILAGKGVLKTEEDKIKFDNGIEITFDASIYGHKDVKNRLVEVQHHKCCFCESKITHIAFGDVEHYRPKAGWVQNNEAINKPGYYWLAYDWDNLLLSCQICNQHFKKNYFPLATKETRAYNHNYDINTEDPLFIHPVNENPELYISFNEEKPEAIDNNLRGLTTIANLGLDRNPLNEERKQFLNMVMEIYELAKDFPEIPQENKKRAKDKILKYYNESQKNEIKYASMLRCFFKKYPINF